MNEIESKIQSLRAEYMEALRHFLRSSVIAPLWMRKADRVLQKLQKITNNPNLTGLNVVHNQIPIKEAKK